MATGSTFNARTYGRKSSAKRKQLADDGVEMTPQRKRRRVSEERKEAREVSTDVEDDGNDTQPMTPRTVAKDLSKLFELATPTSSPSRSPTKLASRMLARSKTDSSIDSNSNVLFDRTPSLPNLPSSSPPKPVTSPAHDQRPASAPIPIPTNTRTYAGKSRSFLVAIPAASLDAFHGAEDEDEYTSRESYASLRSRWGVDNSEDDPYPLGSPSRSDATSTPSGTPTKARRAKTKAQQEALLRAQITLPNGMMNPLKSITELRSKGESRRFLDEVGYLFEGMDSSGGIGLRRASAIEITTKLCDVEFARKAKAADFLGRAWDVFLEAGAGRGEDKILDTLLAFFAALVSRDPASLADLAQRTPVSSDSTKPSQRQPSSLVDTLFSLLSIPADPLTLIVPAPSQDRARQDLELKKLGVGKKDRAVFVTIRDTIISKSSLFPPSTPISLSLLLTRALHTLPPALLPVTHLPTLLASLQRLLSPLSSSSTSAHLAWPDAARDLPFEGVLYHLQMFDVFLLGQWGTGAEVETEAEDAEDAGNETGRNRNGNGKERERESNEGVMDKAREEWLVDALVALGVCAELRGGASANKCMETTLRVLVSLTHADARWAGKVLANERALPFVMRIILRSGAPEGRVGVVKREDVDEDVDVKVGVKDRSNGKEKGKGKEEVGNGKWKVKKRVKQEAKVSDDDVDVANEGEGEGEGEDTHTLDRLCLALGLLTNLVQVVESTKDLLRDICLSPTCSLAKRTCIRRCTCSSSSAQITALDVLIWLYNRSVPPPSHNPTNTLKSESPSLPELEQAEAETETADTLFLRGHLAVLFGLLIRGSHANEVHILGALSNPSPTSSGYAAERAKVGRLVEQAREFIAFYEVLGGGEARGDDVEREGRVARDVLLFLENLRDGAV